MGVFKEYCSKGHKMEDTQKYLPNGSRYCYECKKLQTYKDAKKYPDRVSLSTWKSKIKKLYNLTESDYSLMFENQNGCCGICLNPVEYRGKNTHIDHCHTSGKVRKILCSNCNTAIGLMKDDVEILKKAIEYIEEYQISNDAGKAFDGVNLKFN